VLRIRDVLSRIRLFSHPGPGSKHFLIPDPTWKVECKLTFFLASYAFWSTVLVLFIVIKIRVPGSEIRDPDKFHPGIRIQNPGGKKAPDPGSGSATLLRWYLLHVLFCLTNPRAEDSPWRRQCSCRWCPDPCSHPQVCPTAWRWRH
jgi:hypothetical protein